MTYSALTTAETDADSPITAPLMTKIKDNFDDHETRLNNTPPIGAVAMWPYSAVPSKWLFCDGSEISATTYESLFDKAISDLAAWGRGTAVGTFTVDTTTDEITCTAHGKVVDDVVYFTSTTTLPAPLTADTKYYVISVPTANTMQISATKSGTAVDFTTTGTGTHSMFDNFNLPDARAKSPLGVNDAGLPAGADGAYTTRNEGDIGGEENHQLTTAELASHTHTVFLSDSGTTGSQEAAGASNGAGSDISGSTGSDTAHNTMHPFFTVNFIIYTAV